MRLVSGGGITLELHDTDGGFSQRFLSEHGDVGVDGPFRGSGAFATLLAAIPLLFARDGRARAS